MPSLILSPPNDRQRIVLEDTEHKYIAFGGARGGGKSWMVRAKATLLCLNYPGITCMIVRKTYPELRENHITPLTTMLKCYNENRSERIASYNDSKKCITFPNGSRILFRYCDTEIDAQRFQGTEVDVLFLDEATHQPEIVYDKLKACVRGVNAYPKRIYITCNPGGVGHQWVKRLFVDRSFKPMERPEEYTFVRSRVTDNYALMESDPDYIHQLEALPEKLRKAWLEGDFDVFEGQFFEDLVLVPSQDHLTGTDEQTLRERHLWCHVIPPFESVPMGWQVFRAFDWGYARPFACEYFTMDWDGALYMIAEMYGCTGDPNVGVKWDASKVFSEMKTFEDTHPLLKGRNIIGVADPSIWDKSRGEPIAEMAIKHGITFTPGDNKRIPGWMQIHYRLAFDENGKARLYICDNCRHAIRTLPLLQYDETHVEDLDTEGEDHIADALRYMCMSRPVAPLRPTEAPRTIFDPLNQYSNRRY